MKLRNKKTGKIIECGTVSFPVGAMVKYKSLAELNEEWEDAPEEPKDYWTIDIYAKGPTCLENSNDDMDKFNKEIGNYFETEEEAEKAVEKLKAWKRLKDKGFEIEGWTNDICDNYYKTGDVVLNLNNVRNRDWNEYTQISEIKNELDLLFGGEE